MAAVARAPKAEATSVGAAENDPNMLGLIIQPDGMEDNDNNDVDEDNKDDKSNNDVDGKEEEDGENGDFPAPTVLEEMLLLVDAANGFNNFSHYSMLWTVRRR